MSQRSRLARLEVYAGSVLTAADGVHHWRFVRIEVPPAPGMHPATLVRLGDARAPTPHYSLVGTRTDVRVGTRADAALQRGRHPQRCEVGTRTYVALNGQHLTVVRSFL